MLDDITAPRLLTAVFAVESRWLWSRDDSEPRLTAVLSDDLTDVMLNELKENNIVQQINGWNIN